MFIKLLVLFTIVPVAELFVLIEVGQYIGTMNTILLIILTGIIGASFAKAQGAQIIQQIRITMGQGQIPGKELLHGVMILAGGILLLTPGFITDYWDSLYSSRLPEFSTLIWYHLISKKNSTPINGMLQHFLVLNIPINTKMMKINSIKMEILQ